MPRRCSSLVSRKRTDPLVERQSGGFWKLALMQEQRLSGGDQPAASRVPFMYGGAELTVGPLQTIGNIHRLEKVLLSVPVWRNKCFGLS